MKVIATNGILNIVDIIYDINDSIVLDNGQTRDIEYDDENNPYFVYHQEKYYLNEFIKINN